MICTLSMPCISIGCTQSFQSSQTNAPRKYTQVFQPPQRNTQHTTNGHRQIRSHGDRYRQYSESSNSDTRNKSNNIYKRQIETRDIQSHVAEKRIPASLARHCTSLTTFSVILSLSLSHKTQSPSLCVMLLFLAMHLLAHIVSFSFSFCHKTPSLPLSHAAVISACAVLYLGSASPDISSTPVSPRPQSRSWWRASSPWRAPLPAQQHSLP